ncbi:hypothetical protein FLA105534_03514 [Flavobacterium bizetiae]|uniref:Uncharacterized protein n=1 Tax=Flavobacterium bizetiae TaxID=2704140 RepID=A0A6J4GQK8_9FLAO|nr:hypothetical protein [Flavobacterium bizetiae]CAA9201286.1 hypothetical protein FLA105534_03514 [Flavobacterium bizetiae]CAD5344074.1 hypothetical protein FLA105535_04079 [Flavobacterium bizetiae]CAD5350078.1 hypothetical protein FLA105534_04068 [Flavobacterium bizetiae]
MKANKWSKKHATKVKLSDKSIRAKDRFVNSIVFTVVFCIAVFIISKLV